MKTDFQSGSETVEALANQYGAEAVFKLQKQFRNQMTTNTACMDFIAGFDVGILMMRALNEGFDAELKALEAA